MSAPVAFSGGATFAISPPLALSKTCSAGSSLTSVGMRTQGRSVAGCGGCPSPKPCPAAKWLMSRL